MARERLAAGTGQRLTATTATGRRSRASAAPERPSKLRLWLRRRRALLRPAGLGVLGLVGLAALGAGVMAMDPAGRLAALAGSGAELGRMAGLSVSEVTLEGSRNVPPEMVRAAVGVNRGDPILAFSPQAARERLESIPWISHAHVERHLPGRILVRIEEREPFAVWQHNGRFAVIDRSGTPMSDRVQGFGELPLVVGAGAEKLAAPMIDLLRGMPELRERTQALVRVGERRWNLLLRTGTDVLLPDGQEAAALGRLVELQRTQRLLDRPVLAIDLRLPDKMVLRLPPSEQNQPGPNGGAPRVRNVRG